jgi:proteic killer suppression protein
MIRTIRHKGLAALHRNGQTRGVRQTHVKRLRQILALLNTAKTVDDMDLPGMKLHPLKGHLEGFYAVAVSGNWRVIFRFENSEALDVDYLDYH